MSVKLKSISTDHPKKDKSVPADNLCHFKSVEREHTIQELQKHNEELQETVNLNKGSMSFMTSYIGELEKLIIDDDVDFYY